LKIAVVIPWFGRELKGGAEQHAWQVAARLAGRGHGVEVLTTCCRSHQEDWSTNHLPPGRSAEPEGFSLRRFPVDARNRPEFDRVCAHLLSRSPESLRPGVSPVSAVDSHIFATELIKSARLLDFIAAQKGNFDAFVFLPYLYGLILEGIRIVGRTAALQPCLHDEAYAYLPEVAEAFRTAGSLLFISEGEQELAFRLFGPGIWSKSTLTGAGIETEDAENEAAPPSAQSPSHPEKFLLYLGRKDAGKNVPLLLNAFARFRRVRPNSPLRLILAGHGKVDLNGGAEAAADLGLVSEQEKRMLLQDCTALVQPSQNESFSRVMMEAWLRGKPVAAHARCLATAVAVERSGGGWTAETESDWARLLIEIDRLPAGALSELGERGKRYAVQMAEWESVMNRYEVALAQHPAGRLSPRGVERAKGPAINQFLPNLAHGDAISNHAIWIRDQLHEAGYDSQIYVQYVDPQVADQCDLFTVERLEGSDAAIYHHSIGTEITPHLIEFGGPKCLIYHNITPGEFFEAYRPEFAQILYKGRHDLQQLGKHFQISVGDSAFNAAELARNRFPHPGVLPLAIDPCKWAFRPDPAIMEQLQDGRTNILFVGRFAPNKKQEDLIVAFSHYLQLDPGARLILVGKPESADPYVIHLSDLVAHLGLSDSVLLPGSIAEAQLAAYYRSAHLFWSMSEHEGFCVPLIESMWFDVPIMAFKSSVVPETLAEAGFMFTGKNDMPGLAALAHLLVTDSALREKLVRAQRRRRLEFLPEKVLPLLMDMVAKLFPSKKTMQPRARCGDSADSTKRSSGARQSAARMRRPA
jgi:glycosyltransferase involved in cell wall biosynthesis